MWSLSPSAGFGRGALPYGKLTLIEGDPDKGKSTLTLDITARVTKGVPMPGSTETRPPAAVVLIGAEDALADTVRPRLDAAGADASRVFAITTVQTAEGPRPITLPDDIGTIGTVVERHGAQLVVIDPLMAFLGGTVNSHRDQDVRRALAPLAQMAERTGAAVVIVRHLNKGTGSALYKGGGSIGITGAARSVLLAAEDPEDPDNTRVLARVKCNVAAPVPSLRYRLEASLEHEAPRISWLGESPLGADELVQAKGSEDERSQMDEATDLLRDLFDGSQRLKAKEIYAEGKGRDISARTLRRARHRLKIGIESEGFAGTKLTYWTTPDTWPVRSGEVLPVDSKNTKTNGKPEPARTGQARTGQAVVTPLGQYVEPRTGQPDNGGAVQYEDGDA